MHKMYAPHAGNRYLGAPLRQRDGKTLLASDSHFRMMHVFQLVDGSSRCGMADMMEESAAAFDGNQMPEEFCHLVVVGLFPGIGSRHAEQTFYAYHLLPASEHISANGAGSGEE